MYTIAPPHPTSAHKFYYTEQKPPLHLCLQHTGDHNVRLSVAALNECCCTASLNTVEINALYVV